MPGREKSKRSIGILSRRAIENGTLFKNGIVTTQTFPRRTGTQWWLRPSAKGSIKRMRQLSEKRAKSRCLRVERKSHCISENQTSLNRLTWLIGLRVAPLSDGKFIDLHFFIPCPQQRLNSSKIKQRLTDTKLCAAHNRKTCTIEERERLTACHFMKMVMTGKV